MFTVACMYQVVVKKKKKTEKISHPFIYSKMEILFGEKWRQLLNLECATIQI